MGYGLWTRHSGQPRPDLRPKRLPSLALMALCCLAPPALAQQAPEEKASILQTADPLRGPVAGQAAAEAARAGAETEMTYATEIQGDLSAGRITELEPDPAPSAQTLPRPGPIATWAVVALLLALLLAWLRFGGSGTLLTRAPEAQKPAAKAPEAWNISAEDQSGDPRSLIDQIAAMPDRAAALVRLLRHCLLQAATETDTRLARADTERSAFRRLPVSWRHRAALSQILRQAELAHYGGRPVPEAEFAAAIAQGRSILTGKATGSGTGLAAGSAHA